MSTPQPPVAAPTRTRFRPAVWTWPAPRHRRRQTLPPPLRAGDHLSRAEFERRYEAHPEIKKAELVEGVVYMPSPVQSLRHGRPHAMLTAWLVLYESATPGTATNVEATVRLDERNEVQPDVLLRLSPRLGGRSRVTEDDYLEGPPELVVEIAASSAAYDLHSKRLVYQRVGVPEYLVLQMYERRADWFILRGGVYEPLEADADGLLRSEVFPGLVLRPEAVWEGDIAALLSTLQEGLDSPEHAAFVERLMEMDRRSR